MVGHDDGGALTPMSIAFDGLAFVA